MCEWAVSLMYKYDPSSKRDVNVSFWDKEQLAQFIKDMVDDVDQKDGFIFNRFYADCCHNGVPIPWEDVL